MALKCLYAFSPSTLLKEFTKNTPLVFVFVFGSSISDLLSNKLLLFNKTTNLQVARNKKPRDCLERNRINKSLVILVIFVRVAALYLRWQVMTTVIYCNQSYKPKFISMAAQ